MIPIITKKIIYPILQYSRGEHIYKHLKGLEKSQWLSPRDLENRQWIDLKSLLRQLYMYNAYYRRRFIDSGILSEKIKTYDDFLKFPILEKEDLRRDVKKMLSSLRNGPLESRKTSGSTGIPLEILKSRDSFGRIRAIYHRYYKWYGIDIGDKQARFMGHPVTFKARLKEDIQDFLLNKYRLDPVFLTEKNMLTFYRQVKRTRSKYFYGYPSAIYEFSKFIKSNSFNPIELGVKIIITTGETLYDFQRKYIEEALKTKVVNEYGCSESGIIAFECPKGRMHLSTDNLFIEILKDGNPALPGEVGEVVITELYNYSVPLVRYRVGDLIKVSSQTHCNCGSGLPCIDSVEGRTSQFIELPNGRKVHTELFHYISDSLTQTNGVIKQFRIIQNKGLEFTIEYCSDGKNVDKAIDYMANQLKKFFGENILFTFRSVDAIERDKSGKLRYFYQQRDTSLLVK